MVFQAKMSCQFRLRGAPPHEERPKTYTSCIGSSALMGGWEDNFSTVSPLRRKRIKLKSLIYSGGAKINEVRKRQQILGGGRKRVLIVLFIPSVEGDGVSTIDQPFWVDLALETLGYVFGGATAFPKAKGTWRDDGRGGTLEKDEPIIVHCYTTPVDIEDERNLAALGDLCRKPGRETHQGEVGLGGG